MKRGSSATNSPGSMRTTRNMACTTHARRAGRLSVKCLIIIDAHVWKARPWSELNMHVNEIRPETCLIYSCGNPYLAPLFSARCHRGSEAFVVVVELKGSTWVGGGGETIKGVKNCLLLRCDWFRSWLSAGFFVFVNSARADWVRVSSRTL